MISVGLSMYIFGYGSNELDIKSRIIAGLDSRYALTSHIHQEEEKINVNLHSNSNECLDREPAYITSLRDDLDDKLYEIKKLIEYK